MQRLESRVIKPKWHDPLRPRRSRPEEDICREFISAVDRDYPFFSECVIHYPGGGKRTRAEAGMFKAIGTRSGVSDYLICLPFGIYPLAWIEVKANGSLTDDQIKFIEARRDQGHAAMAVWGIDELMTAFTCYVQERHDDPFFQMLLNTTTRRSRQAWKRKNATAAPARRDSG